MTVRRAEGLLVRVDHDASEFGGLDGGGPAELLFGLGGVANEVVDLGGAEVAGVEADVASQVEAGVFEREADEVSHGVAGSGGEDVVAGLVGLEHAPHPLDSIGGFDASFRICGDLDALHRLMTVGTLWSTSVLIVTVGWGGLSTQPAGSVELVRERRRILRRYRSPAAAEWLAVLPVIRRAVVRWSRRVVRALLGRGAASRVLVALRRHRAV